MTDRAAGRPRSEAVRAVLLVAIGSLAALGALALTWGTADAPVLPGAPGRRVISWTGASLLPWAPPAAVVSGMCAVAVLGTRTWGRMLVGAAGAAAAAAVLAGAIWAGINPPADAATGTWWWLAAAAGSLAALLGCLLIMVRGRTWPGLGSRYERSTPEGPAAASAWDRIGRGEDPTLDPP